MHGRVSNMCSIMARDPDGGKLVRAAAVSTQAATPTPIHPVTYSMSSMRATLDLAARQFTRERDQIVYKPLPSAWVPEEGRDKLIYANQLSLDNTGCGQQDDRRGNLTVRTVMTPFGLRFVEPLEASFPAREVAGAVLDQRRQIAVFDGRPLCELMATDMVESRPTEKDGKDPINVDSDPFYD